MSYKIQDGVGDEISDGTATMGSAKQLYVRHDADEVQIKNFELVASYNWTNETKFPTLIVPGAPNIWTPKKLPIRVPQDSGRVFVDQNKDRFPLSPIGPLIRVVNLVNPEFDLSQMDILSDRNNLRKLFRWVTNSPELKDFRIDAELAGNTVLFTRWDESSSTIIRGFRGFGHEFEKANTSAAPGCENSTGHHRIVTYELGDIKLLVRYEVDGCLALTADPKEKTRTGPAAATTSPKTKSADDDDLAAALGGLKISGEPIPFDLSNTKLHYIPNGLLVDQSEVMELKTRVQHKQLDWEETWPQLFLSQTRYLLLAKHFRGEFVIIEKNDFNSDQLKEYVRRGKAGLIRLKSVLKTMKVLVVKYGKGNHGLSFVYENGNMKVFLRNDSKEITKVDPSLLEQFSKKEKGVEEKEKEADEDVDGAGDETEKKVQPV